MQEAEIAVVGDWPPHAFEDGQECLFCHGSHFLPAIDGVGDWFFECVPFQSAFVRCQDCHSLVQSPCLRAEFLPRAYAAYYTHADGSGELGRSGLKGKLRAAYVAARFAGDRSLTARLGAALYKLAGGNLAETDAAFRFAPPAPARVLDYGCGGGAYLGRMAGQGYDVTGVDFDPVSVAKVREAGIAAFEPEDAARQDWAEKFDLVTLGHVIEHVYDPAALLAQLHGWLAPGGQLYIECPNAQATGLDLFGRYWRGLEAPRHLGIPSREGLQGVLDEAGFTIEQTIVRAPIRQWMWDESKAAAPAPERDDLLAGCASAPPLTAQNAEFLTVIARRKEP